MMSSSWINEQMKSFDPQLPIEDAWLPPSSWYTDPGFYQIERESVFRNNWLIAAREDQLRNPGDYVAGTVANEPYVVVRGEDKQLRAFYNVCRHHAAAVMVGEGNSDALVCPYHGWTYALDGSLRRAPELGGVRDFDRDCFGLMPMQVAQWGTLVFICMGDAPGSIDGGLTELQARLERMKLGELRFVRRVSSMVKCNWKVYVDNYLDGGYHVAYLHKGLANQLDLDSYRTEVFDRYSIQSGAGAGADGGNGGTDFAERIGDEVLYAWIYPNLMINRYGSIMDTNWILPRGADETEVIFDYYFLEEGQGREEFIAQSLAASDVVQQEDVDICESVQRGLESSSYDRGRYSVKREMGEHHFHRLLAADFSARGR
jgi:choline monooxygenase